MTPAETKAPLPDDVERAIGNLYNDALSSRDGYGSTHDDVEKIRAHIEAQAKQVELYRNAAIDLMVMRDKAEAENERLRGANQELHQHVTFYHRWATADVT